MDKEQIIKIVEANGWRNLGEQKMKAMMSFVKDNLRLNIYTTTGTITFQSTLNKRSSMAVYRDVTIDNLNEFI
jgi:hypothetical protein